MKSFLSIFAVFFAIMPLYGQILSGKVSATDGNPVAYATIYIHETSSGVITDGNGAFQSHLSPGTYTVEARFLGYETQIQKVEVTASGADVKFVLAEKIQPLQEVTVRPSKEDPAYDVMRHAIARAPYHLYQVESYTCDNYLKGSAKIDHLPALVKMMIKDQKLKSMVGHLFVLESHNEITYRAPSSYVQRVLAYKSSIPKEIEPKGGIRAVTSSVYAPKFGDCISPLSPQAFQYYRFRLAEIYPSGKYQINKVMVTPKLRNAALYSGYIYIVDGDWSVFALDLSVTEAGSTEYDKINYQELQPGVFLPITYNINTNIGTMGIKGFARFYSSIKYKSIHISASAKQRPAKVQAVTEPTIRSKKQQKAEAEMAKLSAKEKFTTADALRMARLSTQMLESGDGNKKRKNLEIRDTSMVKMQVDSLASVRDSAYWESVRKVPLLTDEIRSFQRVDSIPVSKSLKATENGIEYTLDDSMRKGNLLKGGRLSLGDSVYFRYSGLVRGVVKEYNFVDGWWLGQRLSLSMPFTKTSRLTLIPWAYYVTGRKAVNWNTEVKLNYLPLSNGLFSVSGGSSSADIQGDKGTGRDLNAYTSFTAGNNVIRFYKSNSVKIANSIDIANGLILSLGAGYENRMLLANSTTFHLWGKEPCPNVPEDVYAASFPQHTATTAWVGLTYTPFMRYRIVKGKKLYAGSAYPTFNALYQTAFRMSNNAEQSDYNRLVFGVNQTVKLDIWSVLKYSVSAGGFLSDKRLYAPDYYYFRTSPLCVTYNSLDNSFALLPNYSFSTGKWAEAHLSWQSDYLLLKRLPFMQRYIFNEALHLKCLYENGSSRPYYEAGYTIGLMDLMRGGIFTSFRGKEFQRAGIRISVPLSALMLGR